MLQQREEFFCLDGFPQNLGVIPCKTLQTSQKKLLKNNLTVTHLSLAGRYLHFCYAMCMERVETEREMFERDDSSILLVDGSAG